MWKKQMQKTNVGQNVNHILTKIRLLHLFFHSKWTLGGRKCNPEYNGGYAHIFRNMAIYRRIWLYIEEYKHIHGYVPILAGRAPKVTPTRFGAWRRMLAARDAPKQPRQKYCNLLWRSFQNNHTHGSQIKTHSTEIHKVEQHCPGAKRHRRAAPDGQVAKLGEFLYTLLH